MYLRWHCILCGIVLFLNKEKIKFYNVFQGIIIYLTIFTKQNIGMLYLIAIIIAEIFSNKKEAIHSIIREITVTLVLALVTVGIMLLQSNFNGFLNYTILGMLDFTGSNLTIQETVEFIIIAYGLIAIASYIQCIMLYKTKKIEDKNIIFLLIFAITLNFSAYPIFNLYHTSFAILLNIIIFIYIFEKLLLEKIQSNKIKIALVIVTYLIINIFGINCGLKTSKNIKIVDNDNVYYSANMSEELNRNLKEVTEYILKKEKEGIEVICVSADSALYMTAINKNHGELDLIFNGNLGYNGKENTIEKIKGLENTEILMNENIYWQELTELREYILQNYTKSGKVGECNVYTNSNDKN